MSSDHRSITATINSLNLCNNRYGLAIPGISLFRVPLWNVPLAALTTLSHSLRPRDCLLQRIPPGCDPGWVISVVLPPNKLTSVHPISTQCSSLKCSLIDIIETAFVLSCSKNKFTCWSKLGSLPGECFQDTCVCHMWLELIYFHTSCVMETCGLPSLRRTRRMDPEGAPRSLLLFLYLENV